MDEKDDRRLIQHAMLMLCKDDARHSSVITAAATR